MDKVLEHQGDGLAPAWLTEALGKASDQVHVSTSPIGPRAWELFGDALWPLIDDKMQPLELLRECLPYLELAAPQSTGRTPSEIARDMKRLLGHGEPTAWGSATWCESEMRRLTNGERGCANPREHAR